MRLCVCVPVCVSVCVRGVLMVGVCDCVVFLCFCVRYMLGALTGTLLL